VNSFRDEELMDVALGNRLGFQDFSCLIYGDSNRYGYWFEDQGLKIRRKYRCDLG